MHGLAVSEALCRTVEGRDERSSGEVAFAVCSSYLMFERFNTLTHRSTVRILGFLQILVEDAPLLAAAQIGPIPVNLKSYTTETERLRGAQTMEMTFGQLEQPEHTTDFKFR